MRFVIKSSDDFPVEIEPDNKSVFEAYNLDQLVFLVNEQGDFKDFFETAILVESVIWPQ